MWIFMVNHDFEGDSNRYKNFEHEEKKKNCVRKQWFALIQPKPISIFIYESGCHCLIWQRIYIPEVDPAQ